MPSVGPPCIHEAHFRHRGASVSGALRPSSTVAAWHPGPVAPFRGKASVCLVYGSAFARLHPRPGNGGKVPASPSAASRCSPTLTTLSVCLGSALSTQVATQRPKHSCRILRRQPTRLRSSPIRITPLFLPAIATAWEAATAAEASASGRCRGSAAPQNISANTLAHPIIGHYAK